MQLWHWLWVAEPAQSSFLTSYLSLRGSYFTGFLTLGSLLVAASNWILTTIKAQVYETKSYEARYEQFKRENPGAEPILAPLKRLADSLYATMCVAFLTSACQGTVGFFACNGTALISYLMTLVTMVVAARMFRLLHLNILDWVEHDPNAKPHAALVRVGAPKESNSPTLTK